jgi:hypothetical protein
MDIYDHIYPMWVLITVDNVYNNMVIYAYSINYRHHSMRPPSPQGL